MLKKKMNICIIACTLLIVLSVGCTGPGDIEDYPDIEREDLLPADIIKREPAKDYYPPILHSNDYDEPVPLQYPVNTAGGEDCPVIQPDGKTLYFFFTPDVRVPVEKQLLDGVTGTYVSYRTGDSWSKPERVWLEDPGKLSLDGTLCIQDHEMWFCSVREGYTGVNMFTAELADGVWKNWKYAGDRLMKEIQIGEVYIHGDDLYFHSARPGGKGGYDIWVSTRHQGTWSDPKNIEVVNTDAMDGFPFISTDGNELWFTRTYMGTPAIFRSVKINAEWRQPELILSQFAGGAKLDDAGNIFFVHHYYENGEMVEGDIYYSRRK